MKSSYHKTARFISVIGHPFLLMPLLTGIVAYHLLPPKEALLAELLALGVVILPAGLYTLFRVRQGRWGDLDVSDQRDRHQFYGILLPLLLIIALISWTAEVPRAIPLGALAIITLVGTAFLLNRWVKVSLHTGFGVFAGETLLLFNPLVGGIVLSLSILVGWSRIALGRHTVSEVLVGGLLGCIVGGVFVLTLRFLQ